MVIAVAVIALAVAIVAMGVAWRAWPRGGRTTAGRLPPDDRLVRAVEVLVVIDLLAGAGLGVSFARNGNQVASPGPGHSAGTKSPTSLPPAQPPARRGTSSSAPPTSARPSSVPSTLSTSRQRTSGSRGASSGPKPVLVKILPASGAPGQRVTLQGKGFFSPDGHITVTFGPAEAPVACPSETTCHATVPARAPRSGATVPVRVSTATGRSNPVAFSYG